MSASCSFCGHGSFGVDDHECEGMKAQRRAEIYAAALVEIVHGSDMAHTDKAKRVADAALQRAAKIK